MVGGPLSEGEQLLILTQLDQLFTLDLRLMYPLCILQNSVGIQAPYITSKGIFLHLVLRLLCELRGLQVCT
jgi:hypothetical protein